MATRGIEEPPRQRVPAAERRAALIDAAVEEFAQSGLHGTPVDRIARRVGVAQPYVFSLFPSKRDLFIAAVERGFERVTEVFDRCAAGFDPALAEPGTTVLSALGAGYVEMLKTERPVLMIQLHAYAACDDEVIRTRVRAEYARLIVHVQKLSGAEPKLIEEFISQGMWLNVAAAMGVQDLSITSDWIRDAGATEPSGGSPA